MLSIPVVDDLAVKNKIANLKCGDKGGGSGLCKVTLVTFPFAVGCC